MPWGGRDGEGEGEGKSGVVWECFWRGGHGYSSQSKIILQEDFLQLSLRMWLYSCHVSGL